MFSVNAVRALGAEIGGDVTKIGPWLTTRIPTFLLCTKDYFDKSSEIKSEQDAGRFQCLEKSSSTLDCHFALNVLTTSFFVIAVPECSDLLKVQKKTISSSTPHYIDNIHCTTALYPPSEACGMELTFQEFSLEGPRETCPYDYLEINDDKLCGNMKNELREVIFPRNTPKIPIIFSTDSTFVSRGFNITFTWITECFSWYGSFRGFFWDFFHDQDSVRRFIILNSA